MEMYSLRGFFFRSSGSSSSYSTNIPEFCVQVPSVSHRAQMHSMPAGGDEDQEQRLTHMVQVIEQLKQKYSSLFVMTTDKSTLSDPWNELFAAIKNGDEKNAEILLSQISPRDTLLQAILAVHSLDYLKKLVRHSAQAYLTQGLQLNSDITITSGTFEVVVKDIAATLFHPAKVHCSFGLPTHHAFSIEGSGFCILDKTAILMKYIERTSMKPIKYIVIDTDVNRDNGLNYNLMDKASLDVCHIDIFDSRVYPSQNHADINMMLQLNGVDVGQKIKRWSCGPVNYFAIDLCQTTRKGKEIHPALVFALQQMEEQIKVAKANRQEIMIMLPTGWDSHQEETADCGKWVNGRMMGQNEAQKTRFNDEDLRYFYENVFQLYLENKRSIKRVYWGLEGGYHRPMYEAQIQLLISIAQEKLGLEAFNHNTPPRL